jgi:anti-sigma-K factor RskA
MDAGHDHFEQLAVGHVLGGLGADEAARFRSHLTGCRDCRARVAELRDIATDLAAAEREERARARVKTEVARRDDDRDTAVEPPWSVSTRALAVALAGTLLLVLGLAFWNFHLRDQNARLLAVTEAREEVLEGLATGTPVVVDLAAGVTGQVVADATDVTVDLAGLPTPGQDERLVVWLLGEAPTDHYWRGYRAGDLSDGRLALRDPHRGADRLVVTLEPLGELADEPTGRELVGADLRGVG